MQFIEELDIRKPDLSLKVSRSNATKQFGEIIIKLSKILPELNPDTVIVEGDTNTVLAAGIASLKSGIPVSHVESGLRSFDWRMPEEHNRVAIDHISEILFAPTQHARKNLTREHVHGRIFVTGNTAMDAINKHAPISSKKSNLSINVEDYILVTLHRSENVDDSKILSSIIRAIIQLNENVVFPVHPRTIERLHHFNLYKKLERANQIHLIESIGYFDMLELMKNCSFIVTDSGGIQEEATSPKIRKKVVVVRKTSDRPEAVEAGFAELAGISYNGILNSIKRNCKNPRVPARKSPYGSGNSSDIIIKLMRRHL